MVYDKSMVNLFNDVSIKFEKRAMETQLSDNTEQWQQEVASELYRQVPYASNYATDILLDKVDQQRGYGFGNAVLKNKYDMPQPEQDNRNVSIPIIIRDRMLKPFDVYKSENNWFPLSEQRISQALFKTQPLELTDRKPTDKMISPQMYPPTRSHVNATVSTAGFGKYASPLDKIDISKKEVESFLQKISSDVGLQQAYLDNQAFRNAVNKVASKRESAVSVEPTVIQLTKLSAKRFLVKSANVNAFEPKIEEASVQDIAEQIGDEAYSMKPGSVITASVLGPVVYETALNTKIASEPGMYKCQDSMGRDVFGSVLPITNLSGERTGDSLFINDKAYSINEKIAGKKIANEVDLLETTPSGYGTFYSPNTNTVTEPVNIQYSTLNNSGNKVHVGTTQSGASLNIIRSPQVVKTAHVSGNTFVMPTNYQWIHLPSNEISVRTTEGDAEKIANAKNTINTLEIRRFDDEYSIGGFPVAKLAESQKVALSKTEAEFVVATTGLNPEIVEKVANEKVLKIAGARTIVPMSIAKEAAKKEVMKVASKLPALNKNLIKEAAVFNDQETVDNILSLGFLRPDNIKNFSGYLPELEKTTNKLADLLFASRCGLSTIPEEAVESAMRNTDQVISGLRTLQEQEMM